MRRSLLAIFLTLLVGVGIGGGVASAITQDQQDVFSEGINYYDTAVGSNTCGGGGGSISLSGSDNPQKAFNFLVQKGLSGYAAAGVVGNLMEESSVDPKKVQGGSEAGTPPISDSVGWGIAQWTGSGIQQKLVDTAQKQSQPVDDLGFQLNFLWTQLNSNPDYYQLPQLKAATSASQAADIFEAGFERADPTKANLPVRESDAEDVFKQYGAGTVSNSPGGTTTASSSCGTAFTGDFPFYSQCDPKWTNFPYAGDTMCGAGCGPTSMAMIITALTGQVVTPDTVAKWYTDNGLSGSFGTSWGAAPAAAKHWNLTATALGADAAKISQAVQSGSLVIMAGKGGLPFTSAGHFVVVRAVTPDGKWLLGDPDTATGHSNTAEWDPATVIAGVNANGGASSVYGISK